MTPDPIEKPTLMTRASGFAATNCSMLLNDPYPIPEGTPKVVLLVHQLPSPYAHGSYTRNPSQVPLPSRSTPS